MIICAKRPRNVRISGSGDLTSKMAEVPDESSFTDLVPHRLAFVSGPKPMVAKWIKQRVLEGSALKFVSSDLHRRYFALAADFGPVNLGVVHRFCKAMHRRMSDSDGKKVIYCIEDTVEAQANASFLLAAYLVLKCGWAPEDAADPFIGVSAPFKLRPFRDATFTKPSYGLTLLDCLKGLSRAAQLGWFDCESFDARSYEHLDSPLTGDVHQLCPKIVAFKGPLAIGSPHREPDEIAFTPAEYVPILRDLGVSCVVRLNEHDTYDAAEFERAGIEHHDLFFRDCAAPPDDIAHRFLALCAGATGAVAVHCRAGLGRTGTLAALWLMTQAGFGADAAMGWLRIVRPGSVIGEQQHYLKAREARLRPAPADAAAAPGGALHATTRPALSPPDGSALESAADARVAVARQVTAGMCARGMAKAAAAAAACERARAAASGSMRPAVRRLPDTAARAPPAPVQRTPLPCQGC
jgi:hypothetical protein